MRSLFVTKYAPLNPLKVTTQVKYVSNSLRYKIQFTVGILDTTLTIHFLKKYVSIIYFVIYLFYHKIHFKHDLQFYLFTLIF